MVVEITVVVVVVVIVVVRVIVVVGVGVATCGEGFDHITIVREGRVPPAPAKKGRKKGGRRWAEERDMRDRVGEI